MSLLKSVATVARFELQRSQTLPRMLWWLALVAFPPLLVTAIRYQTGPLPPEAALAAPLIVSVLCPGVVCMLGVFLWTAPALLSELEGRSWVYLAVRPRGGLAVLGGKWLAAVIWTLPAAAIGGTLSLLILAPQDWARLAWFEAKLSLLSCLAYGAVFSLLGALIPKRAMVLGVAYVLLFEVVLALVPAAVNLFTFQFRLRCLWVRWLAVDRELVGESPVFLAYFGDGSAAWHLSVFLAMTAGVLLTAGAAVEWNEFTSDAETDV